jgi:hypothetical protein
MRKSFNGLSGLGFVTVLGVAEINVFIHQYVLVAIGK